ncbi:13657_t:CDS:2 [Entrophospora sp. SA101]|nr:13657_t:CDS:2 [Entrophospora sp. SA101]
MSSSQVSRKLKNSIESNASNISNISSTSSTSSPSPDQRLLEVQRKLEPSIFNVQPHSDFIRYLSDFLYNQLNSENIEHLEIEAKLGLLLDKNNPEKTRINLPVECETIISPNESSWIKFENRGKVRVTTNEHGKTTIANLNIYSPRTNCDYRISVNIEKPMEMPRGQYVFERKKNRMSYCHQLFKVDLTQVEEAKHELEIEFIDPKVLYKEKLDIIKKQQSKFRDIVEIFVNNIRLLAKKCN